MVNDKAIKLIADEIKHCKSWSSVCPTSSFDERLELLEYILGVLKEVKMKGYSNKTKGVAVGIRINPNSHMTELAMRKNGVESKVAIFRNHNRAVEFMKVLAELTGFPELNWEEENGE